MLEVKEIHTYYGPSHVLQGVSLKVERGEVVCLLGRNGVGKSTTLKSIMGLTPPREGSITFEQIELLRLKAYKIPQLGISYVPEDRRIFPLLSVKENLLMGTISARTLTSVQERRNLEFVFQLFPVLKGKENQRGGSLSGGQQQMLAIARGLMSNPRLMLLDEPCEGLAPLIVKELSNAILRLRGQGLTVLLVEQNAHVAIRISDRGYVMEKGRVQLKGDQRFLMENAEVKVRCGI
jgi:branched-chain amino acid transport system ATP-binding protein